MKCWRRNVGAGNIVQFPLLSIVYKAQCNFLSFFRPEAEPEPPEHVHRQLVDRRNRDDPNLHPTHLTPNPLWWMVAPGRRGVQTGACHPRYVKLRHFKGFVMNQTVICACALHRQTSSTPLLYNVVQDGLCVGKTRGKRHFAN